jgi:endonuclease-8
VPEGDTIFRMARALHAALAGRSVTRFVSPLPAVAAAASRLKVVGQTVAAVDPRGKHLLMRFSRGPVLHTHMRMSGSWHLYRVGSRWRQPEARARAVVEAGEVIAVCFAAPTVELLSAREVAVHPSLAGLGEDLLGDRFDPTRACAGLRARGETEIAVALLDQAALAGIGNVYKSEVLFLCGVNPFARVKTLTDAQLDGLVSTARAQMKRNLGSEMRRTTSELSRETLWVYERAGRPCRRCGAAIGSRRQGEQARWTWWCPRCQPLTDPA